jgi:hypothetical protein
MNTTKESEEKCAKLAVEIRNILGNGITLSDDVIHYIDSTFSNPTLEELQTILLDDSNCEKDSLLELLFFPDESMQLQLEELLETLRLRQQDEIKVQNFLCREPPQAVFRFPQNSATLELLLPQEVAPLLISRLHIAKHLDPKLCAAVNNRSASDVRNRYKVKIRNARFSPGANKIQFLCDFFAKMEAESHDFNECLDFALSLLDEINADSEIYRALMAKKKFYLRSLEKAKQLESQLQKNNPETLLIEGKRVFLVDKADARKKMLIIDRISRTVYGRTEYFQEFHAGENRMEFRADQDFQDIINKLS